VCCEGRKTHLFPIPQWPLVAALGWLAWGCREAPTPTGPGSRGPDQSPPAITTFPVRDTTVDSIGLLNIEVIARDPSGIDTVTLEISGASLAFPTSEVNDTVFDALYTVALGPLRHKAFSFRVAASDLLGHAAVTDSISVRPR
jgi:hypothetical protein